MITVGICNRI